MYIIIAMLTITCIQKFIMTFIRILLNKLKLFVIVINVANNIRNIGKF